MRVWSRCVNAKKSVAWESRSWGKRGGSHHLITPKRLAIEGDAAAPPPSELLVYANERLPVTYIYVCIVIIQSPDKASFLCE